MQNYDVVIIGGGAAGIQAALYTVRANLTTAVIDSGDSALKLAHKIENFYAVDSTGKELYERGIALAQKLGVFVMKDEAVHIEKNGDFLITTALDEFRAKALIVAVGAKRTLPDIEGLASYITRGVSFCATCDAFFYRKKVVGVIGAGKYAQAEAAVLNRVADKVYVFTNGIDANFEGDKITVVTEPIEKVYGDDTALRGVIVADKQYPLNGLFVANGVMNANAIASTVGVITDNSYIKTDEFMRTNVDGLFAAGDCTGGQKQIAKSVNDGMKAGLSAIAFVKEVNSKRGNNA